MANQSGSGGVDIEVLYKPETSPICAQVGDTIKVNYRGTLTNGKVFDSSYERGNPFEFRLGVGKVIKGWDEGLQGMCIGEKRKLTVSPDYGYGPRGFPPVIPPNSVLIFETELLSIKGK